MKRAVFHDIFIHATYRVIFGLPGKVFDHLVRDAFCGPRAAPAFARLNDTPNSSFNVPLCVR